MRRYREAAILAMAVLAAAVLAAAPPGQTAGTAYAAVLGQGVQGADKGGGPGVMKISQDTKASAVVDDVVQPQNLEAAREAGQMIVVMGTGGCDVDTCYYAKFEDSFELVWEEASVVGREGITSDKGGGDGKTPPGTYGFTMAPGLKEDPGSMLPYHKVVKGDYWVDDPSGSYYNQLVNTSVASRSWDSAENLAVASPYYNYTFALDYNSDRVPGKRLAIFLHCFTTSADSGSAGYIRFPESRAKELVQTATGKTKIAVAADITQLK